MSQCLYILRKLKVAFYHAFFNACSDQNCVYVLIGFFHIPAFFQLLASYECNAIVSRFFFSFSEKITPWKIYLLCLHSQLQKLHCCSWCAAREYSLGKLVNYFSLEQSGNCGFLLQFRLCILRH